MADAAIREQILAQLTVAGAGGWKKNKLRKKVMAQVPSSLTWDDFAEAVGELQAERRLAGDDVLSLADAASSAAATAVSAVDASSAAGAADDAAAEGKAAKASKKRPRKESKKGEGEEGAGGEDKKGEAIKKKAEVGPEKARV